MGSEAPRDQSLRTRRTRGATRAADGHAHGASQVRPATGSGRAALRRDQATIRRTAVSAAGPGPSPDRMAMARTGLQSDLLDESLKESRRPCHRGIVVGLEHTSFTKRSLLVPGSPYAAKQRGEGGTLERMQNAKLKSTSRDATRLAWISISHRFDELASP